VQRVALLMPRPHSPPTSRSRRFYIVDDSAPNAFAKAATRSTPLSRSRPASSRSSTARSSRASSAAKRRYWNEEACFVLLAILERLAADEASFVHGIALKGGILMAGELRSARSSADIDATTGRGRRVDPDQVVEDLRRGDAALGSGSRANPIGRWAG
jgi:hypothetical protein